MFSRIFNCFDFLFKMAAQVAQLMPEAGRNWTKAEEKGTLKRENMRPQGAVRPG
ncbi:MAG: hypothetical protein Q4F72_06840 [Desulfovibrionaceae bacterium]|nr:hypothetical protein [Desulfovibrionaceae bacterium]